MREPALSCVKVNVPSLWDKVVPRPLIDIPSRREQPPPDMQLPNAAARASKVWELKSLESSQRYISGLNCALRPAYPSRPRTF